MKKILIKITIKLLTWLKDNKKMYFDINNDDKNDLQEWIDYLTQVLDK